MSTQTINVAPLTAAKAIEAPAVPQALDHLRDRQGRTEHVLDQLDDQLERLAIRLAPVLREGRPATYPQDSDVDAPSPEDVRGEVARAITGTAIRADRHADRVLALSRRVEAILEALEV